MMREIIEEISKRVEKAEGKIAVFNDKRYEPIEFSEANYHEIGSGKGKKLVFVDGGNAEIIKAPGMSLQMIRNAAAVMKGNKTEGSRKREFYVLATATERGTKGRIFSNGEAETLESREEDVQKFCEGLRKASEVKFAIEMLGEGDITVLDGTLEARNEMEKRHFDELRYEAVTKGKIAAAVAKTTTIVTDRGSSFAAMLSQRKEGSWQYHPAAEIKSEHHKAEMFFAKLHDKSSHVFRCEVVKEQKSSIGEVAAELKDNSKDLAFPGYPYGLVLADKLARISEREAEYEKTKIMATAGSKWKNLRKELAAVDAHEILDSM